jgi:hypothetical protein
MVDFIKPLMNRQIVLAAHLRPMEKVDKDSLGPGAAANNHVVWNIAAGKCNDSLDESISTDVENFEVFFQQSI